MWWPRGGAGGVKLAGPGLALSLTASAPFAASKQEAGLRRHPLDDDDDSTPWEPRSRISDIPGSSYDPFQSPSVARST